MNLNAQKNYWTDTNFEDLSFKGTQFIFPDQFRSAQLAYDEIKDYLFKAPLQDLNNPVFQSPFEISIPLPDGSNEIFRIVESPVYEEGLLDNFPGIKTFLAYCPNHPEWYSRFDITPQGFHAIILGTDQGTIFIDPVSHLGLDKEHYLIYSKKNFSRKNESLLCYLDDKAPINQTPNSSSNSGTYKMLGSCNLRTYRLALSATGEYTTFHGGTVAGALAAQVTSMNRVNGVFERDMAIHMNIIGNNNLIIYTNAATDPFTNGNPGTMINQNQTNTNAVIGSANYDIGHIFGTNSGGLAQLNSPCGTSKARGVTGSSAPVGDPFDIDYVAHEMGHQFGANHTQNNNCNRNSATAMEPGSASTIMGYAGICAPNVQNNSDDYFHGISMQEIGTFITGTGNSCAVNTALSNTAPTLTVPANSFNIPASTPFSLTAFATDPNANTLTYCWEQMNSTTATMPPVATATAGPSFRSFDPSVSPTRYFPNLPAVVAGTTPTWEVLSSVGRTMNFRVVVRDNAPGGGCNDHEDVTVTIIGTAGPFIVTAPNTTGITWAGNSNQTVTWNVANTASAPVSCANVNILISYNGGLTFPDTIANNVPNDGSQSIVVPNTATTNALIIVQCANGTFYDVSNNTFTITAITNDYSFSAATTSASVCVSENASYALSVGVLGSFTNNVSLSVSGLPLGLSTSFSSNNSPPSYSSTLTIGNTGAVAPGTYNFTIQANSTSGIKTVNASIQIIPNLTGPFTLTSPANGLAGISSPVALSWAAISSANYSIILANNASLSNVVESNSNLSTNNYTSGSLAANTTFYWQVKAFNLCDTLTSSIFSFTTANCMVYTSSNIPISISASGSPTVTSNLIISGGVGTINDVNVVSLNGTHTYISDLTFTLSSPNGTNVILLDNICGNQNNFDIQFDDAAVNNNYPCPPTNGGTYIPEQALSAFIGENANGTWLLTIDDSLNQDGGSLNAWGIEICYTPCITLYDTLVLNSCDSAQVNGIWFFNTTLFSDTLIASTSCDSIFTTAITINYTSPVTIINQTTCNAASVGSSSVTLTNTAGCDSVVTTNTSLLNGGTSTVTITACDSAFVAGSWFFASSSFNVTLIGGAANGCDSITTFNVTINNSVTTNENITACDSAFVAGSWFFATQSILENFTVSNGCDSIHTTNLAITNTIISIDVQSACESYTWVNGISYTSNVQNVSYVVPGATASGCDSLYFLDLTILSSVSDTDEVTACGSYTWIDGIIYTSSNNTAAYVELGGAPNGCDLYSTLDLTISSIPSVVIVNNNDTLIATAGLSTYQWYRDSILIFGAINNTFFPAQSGTYTCVASNGFCAATSNQIVIVLTGIKNPYFASVLIYPNPVNEVLNIDLGGEDVSAIRLIDLNGKIVSTLDLNQTQFDMRPYASGMYFIELMNAQQRAIVKIILE